MKPRIRIKMSNDDQFVYTYAPEVTESEALAFLGEKVTAGDFVEFESGRFILSKDYIVSVESSS